MTTVAAVDWPCSGHSQPITPVTDFGGSGFIGRHLVEHLARAGASVRVATRHPPPTAEPSRLARIQQVEADILDDAAVQAAVHGADTVINLVGILSPAHRHTSRPSMKTGLTRWPQRQALGAGNWSVSALGASRTAPALADRSKAAGEAAVRAAFPDATIIRPSLVFGSDDHFFNGFAARARRLPALPLIGGGQTRFQPVYVEDVVAGFTAILATPASRRKSTSSGCPGVYTFKELLEFVCATIRARPLRVPVPFWAAELLGGLLQVFPGAPITRDQVRLLRTDKVVGGSEPPLGDLGVEPQALETIVPEYLSAYRQVGRG